MNPELLAQRPQEYGFHAIPVRDGIFFVPPPPTENFDLGPRQYLDHAALVAFSTLMAPNMIGVTEMLENAVRAYLFSYYPAEAIEGFFRPTIDPETEGMN